MKIDDLINELKEVREEHGNLEVRARGSGPVVRDVDADVVETEVLGHKSKFFSLTGYD
jgi:hypothetical protein